MSSLIFSDLPPLSVPSFVFAVRLFQPADSLWPLCFMPATALVLGMLGAPPVKC